MTPVNGQGLGSLLIYFLLGLLTKSLYNIEGEICIDNSLHYSFGFDSIYHTYFGQNNLANDLIGKCSSSSSEKESAHLSIINAIDHVNRAMELKEDWQENILVIQEQMALFWQFNENTNIKVLYYLQETFGLQENFFTKGEDFVTVVIRSGDKLAEGSHYNPTPIDFVTKLTELNVAHIHLITDSFANYEALRDLLPPLRFKILTTCQPGDKGFFYSQVDTWSDEKKEKNIVETLANYELARKSKATLLSNSTNIGIFISMLRILDGNNYDFLETSSSESNESVLGYFKLSRLPSHYDGNKSNRNVIDYM